MIFYVIGACLAVLGWLIVAYGVTKSSQFLTEKYVIWKLLKRNEQNRATISRYKNTIAADLFKTVLMQGQGFMGGFAKTFLESESGQEFLYNSTHDSKGKLSFEKTMASLQIAFYLYQNFADSGTVKHIPDQMVPMVNYYEG